MRPHAVAGLLRSIARRYPDAAIHVADQNEALDEQFYESLWSELSAAGLVRRPAVSHLSFDCGLSVARNHLVTTTPRKYKLILDDDFAFTGETKIERFVTLLEAHPEAGVVGGDVNRDGAVQRFDFRIDQRNGTFRPIIDDSPFLVHDGIRYRKTDCVVNFALMRRDLFAHLLWDAKLKIAEHADFYVRMMDTPYSVLHTPDVALDHLHPEQDADYASYRGRHEEFLAKVMTKHRLTRIETVRGAVIEMPPGSDRPNLVSPPGPGGLAPTRDGAVRPPRAP